MRPIFFRIILIVPGLFALRGYAGNFPALRNPPGAAVSYADTSLPFMRHKTDAGILSSSAYLHLACVSARLKLYPLAMKFFLRSAGRVKRVSPAQDESVSGDAVSSWPVTQEEDSMLNIPGTFLADSKMATLSELIRPFIDTNSVEQYALILHVKQPVFNRKKVFTGIGNVGHSFITLIRFNRDNSYVCRSFGFYPRKNYPLAASPLFPLTPGMFRNDASHDWDEMAGRFITRRQFRSILRTMESYTRRRYHLSKNNCTDFSLTIAGLGGIHLSGTASGWPLGHGNNPACTGQSILSGNVHPDSTGSDDIFVTLHHPEALDSVPVRAY